MKIQIENKSTSNAYQNVLSALYTCIMTNDYHGAVRCFIHPDDRLTNAEQTYIMNKAAAFISEFEQVFYDVKLFRKLNNDMKMQRYFLIRFKQALNGTAVFDKINMRKYIRQFAKHNESNMRNIPNMEDLFDLKIGDTKYAME